MSETSTPQIDVPRAYEQRVNIGYMQIENGDAFVEKSANYTEAQQKLLASEADLLNIDPISQPDRFVEAHNALLSAAQTELNERLPGVKQSVIDKTARYFADGDEDTRKSIADLLTQRLAATNEVIVADALAYPKDVSGTFNGVARQPVIASSELIRWMKESESEDEYHERITKTVLAHEVMHGIMTAGVQDIWLMDDYVMRNGLQVFEIENPMEMGEMKNHIHGTWINEATLESFRQTIMETEDVRYEPAVMVLHMLGEFKPGLRDRLMTTALDVSGPGPVFGEVEELLGPTGIEEVEKLLAGVTNFAEIETFKGQIVGMLPEDLREKAGAILEQKQEEVFSWRTDYPEKRDKELAEAAVKLPESTS